MKSKFNTVFDIIINEIAAVSANTSAVSANNVNTPVETANAAKPKKHGNIITRNLNSDTLLSFATHLQSQKKFWTGDWGTKDVIASLQARSKKRYLNSMHGIIDYKKCNHPILTMNLQDEFFTKIKARIQQLNQKQQTPQPQPQPQTQPQQPPQQS